MGKIELHRRGGDLGNVASQQRLRKTAFELR